MDPVTLILTALTAGVAAGGQAVLKDAIEDSYTGLKTLIQHKFAGKSNAELALVEYESDPETWQVPLRKALIQACVDQDPEVIEAARRLMTHINPQQAAMGKYNVQFTGNVQGFAQGDFQKVTMNFDVSPSSKDK